MTKTETIWHFILNKALHEKQFKLTQAQVAKSTGFSLSTVNGAIDKPAKIGAIRKESKFFVLQDVFKLLYYWGSLRNLSSDIVFQASISIDVQTLESSMPDNTIYACYSASKYLLKQNAPADYAKVYVYAEKPALEQLKLRFPQFSAKGNINLFVLNKPPHFISGKGHSTLANTFVDIWNLSDWYAVDYLKALEEEINGLL